MNILYTNRIKNGEYILELQRMISLYLLRGRGRTAGRCSISHLHFPKASWELWVRLPGLGLVLTAATG